ncbi:hypothetical protein N9100_00255 [Gammaproteobacteria bacterium]|nr:hypothetical protein [Gammaproteobacteria bacterium]
MDQADLADLLISEKLEKTIAAARGIRINVKTNLSSQKTCVACNGLIPFKRRRVIPGCIRYVECEEDHEKHRKANKRIRIVDDPFIDLIDDIHLASL